MKSLLILSFILITTVVYAQTTITVSSINDPRFISYKDSLHVFIKYYKDRARLVKRLCDTKTEAEFNKIYKEEELLNPTTGGENLVILTKVFKTYETHYYYTSVQEKTIQVLVKEEFMPKVSVKVVAPIKQLVEDAEQKSEPIKNDTPTRYAKVLYYTKKNNGPLQEDSVVVNILK